MGKWATPEQAAQAYLDHQRQHHPNELAALQQPLPHVVVQDERTLIRSNSNTTDFKGVRLDKGWYQALCNTPPCRSHYLGKWDTLQQAAQAYLDQQRQQPPNKL